MDNKRIKCVEFSMSKNEEKIIYYTEEEMAEMELEEALIPTEKEIEEAEFELKLLNKLTDWGVI